MFCDECGARNRDGARFCVGCGSPLPGDESTATNVAALAADVPASISRALAPAFEVQKLLGRGGMGAVYLARELSLDRLVAIKVLAGSGHDPARVERFVSEARIAAKLRHPNIVAIHSVGNAGALHYFVMDHIDGPTVSQLVKMRGGLPDPEARSVLAGICRGVAHAHRQGVVHRDLKPGNVMLDSHRAVIVMDFGLAKALGSAGLTDSGVIVGTPTYMSPEQLQGRPATPQSDVYAIGLILFFLLTGRALVETEDVSSVVAQHLGADLKGRVEEEPRIPEDLRPVLSSMLERLPSRRPASLDQVLAKLEASSSSPIPPRRLDETTESLASTPPSGGKEPSSGSVRKQARERMKGLLDKLGKKDR